jgi:serine/threonine-protein kinase
LDQNSSPGGGTAVAERLEAVRASLADRYAVDREIGRGGMAAVYLAHDRQHDRDVAIKVLSPNLAAAIGPDRFLREIRIAARLQHHHILPLFDSGTSHGLLYYVMPYVPGLSLRDRLVREIQLPLPDTLKIAREVADALSFAHASGIVHRDVKPANILLAGFPPPGGSLGQWHALVADFGIAHAAGAADDEALTESGIAVGTPEYMSPEQGTGEPGIDGRADVYALGCVVFEMLAGEPPFRGRTAQATIARHRLDPVPSLRVVRPALPAHVEAAVERAMAKVPADRFPTAAAFAEALEAEPRAVATPVPATPRPTVPPRRWLPAVAALVLLLAAGALFLHRERAGLAAPAADPVWILVSDFEGPPTDSTLALALRELVTAELDQSSAIATMPRAQLVAAMRDAGLADTTPLSGDVARELAVRSSVRAVLGGSVLPVSPGHYSIVLRAIEPDSSRTILTVTRGATDADLVQAAQASAREVRERLGERRSDIQADRALVQVATPSFAAYRLYVEARQLTIQGDLPAGNRLLHQAIALDTGFASAWGSLALNYLTMRDPDSAATALAEALRRPDRLSDVEHYRLEAEAAYALRYDVPSAVHWYDLMLQLAPLSVAGHNDRGIYLYTLGRYEEALAEFQRAETLQRFGVDQAQVAIFNQSVTLLALGRDAEAAGALGKLHGAWADYTGLLLATYQGRWTLAESLATARAADPTTSSWIRTPALTMLAGARAAQGHVAAAERDLRAAMAAADGSARPWFGNSLLLLAAASGRAAGPVPPALLRDTTAGSMVSAGVWAAMNGDLASAERRLVAIGRLPDVQQRRLGLGPALLEATIFGARGNWGSVVRRLGPSALVGELDGADPDQPSGAVARLLVGEAYERLGRPDSAAAFYLRVLDPTHVPFGHLALRGLVHPFVLRRLALVYQRMGRPAAAAGYWKELRSTFVTPDRDLRDLIPRDR